MITSRTRGAVVALSLLLAACGGTAGETTASAAVGELSPTTTTSPTTAPEPAAVVAPTPTELYMTALDRSVDASAYSFSAVLSLRPANGEVRANVSGRVDGANRDFSVAIGDKIVHTTILDGVATVDGPDGPTEIPLSQVTDGPTLDVLSGVRISSVTNGVVIGVLPADLISSVGIDQQLATQDAAVTIYFDDVVRRYEMVDPLERWSVDVSFSDVGIPPPPS